MYFAAVQFHLIPITGGGIEKKSFVIPTKWIHGFILSKFCLKGRDVTKKLIFFYSVDLSKAADFTLIPGFTFKDG